MALLSRPTPFVLGAAAASPRRVSARAHAAPAPSPFRSAGGVPTGARPRRAPLHPRRAAAAAASAASPLGDAGGAGGAAQPESSPLRLLASSPPLPPAPSDPSAVVLSLAKEAALRARLAAAVSDQRWCEAATARDALAALRSADPVFAAKARLATAVAAEDWAGAAAARDLLLSLEPPPPPPVSFPCKARRRRLLHPRR